MIDDVFARLVAEEVKNRVTLEQADYLRLPENWTRWQRALLALTNNLNNQLEELKKAESADTRKYKALGDNGLKLLAECLSEHESRRKKITRFKFHVDARLDEVTRMIALGSDAVDDRMKAVEFLRKAIERHRKMMIDLVLEPTAIDQALWSSLDGKWEFDEINTDLLLEGLSFENVGS
jgi:hypothetical protein